MPLIQGCVFWPHARRQRALRAFGDGCAPAIRDCGRGQFVPTQLQEAQVPEQDRKLAKKLAAREPGCEEFLQIILTSPSLEARRGQHYGPDAGRITTVSRYTKYGTNVEDRSESAYKQKRRSPSSFALIIPQKTRMRPALDYSTFWAAHRAGLCLVSFYIIVHCCGWTCQCCCYTAQPRVDGPGVLFYFLCILV